MIAGLCAFMATPCDNKHVTLNPLNCLFNTQFYAGMLLCLYLTNNTMSITNKTILVAEIGVNAPIEKVWELWNAPAAIMEWNNLSDEWHNTKVENDARTGGKFLFAMGLKDGSFKFDFCGTYTEVKTNELISYTLDDGRNTSIVFTGVNPVKVTETFEANNNDPIDMQQSFCRGVLERFKKYVEGSI